MIPAITRPHADLPCELAQSAPPLKSGLTVSLAGTGRVGGREALPRAGLEWKRLSTCLWEAGRWVKKSDHSAAEPDGRKGEGAEAVQEGGL